MSSINSISGGGFSMMMSGMKRPDPSQMVDNLFSKLDTTNKGYLEKSDLQSALSQLSGSGSSSGSSSTSSSTNVDEIFKKLDGNSDGKITKDEMSSGMKKLADALDSQFNQMRMNGMSQGDKGTAQAGKGGGAPPPGGMPPPPSGSGGANSTSGTSSTSSTQSNSTTKTYDPADANQDGTVSEQERIAYAQAKQDKASASSASGEASVSSTSANSDARVLKQIMDLMHAYSSFDSSTNDSGLSVTA
ncbi:MAG: EF-hand domain-containing protein [Nitrosomonadales bacterium]|nr:EF-hand domain-containing protein [Nitrosomonadales bacterium]